MKQLSNTPMAASVLVATLIASGCASKAHIAYRLDCRANQTFAKCGVVFDTEYDCKAALNEMIRRGASIQERGTCLKVRRG